MRGVASIVSLTNVAKTCEMPNTRIYILCIYIWNYDIHIYVYVGMYAYLCLWTYNLQHSLKIINIACSPHAYLFLFLFYCLAIIFLFIFPIGVSPISPNRMCTQNGVNAANKNVKLTFSTSKRFAIFYYWCVAFRCLLFAFTKRHCCCDDIE